MDLICEKCGCKIDGNSPICMNCGMPIPDSKINQETKERLKAEEHDTHTASNASSTRALGAALIIIGILADVISMFMIFSSDIGAFSTLTIGGTICFLIGLLLFNNG